MLDRTTHIASDLESAKVKAGSLFDTLNMPHSPDGLRILDQDGHEVVPPLLSRGFFRAIKR
jgi:hypothetical protein